jgi:hypothetical protein
MATVSYAITTQQIIELSKLKTTDDLLLQLIQKSSLDQPVTPSDVILLKNEGVSEKVISYLVRLSNPEKFDLPKQEGESVWISDSIRLYKTRDKNGKLVEVLTNLDEEGNRMGGVVPEQTAQAEEERYPEYVPEQPREIYVTVRQEEPVDRGYEYGAPMDNGYYGGIPVDSGYYGGSYPSSYYPTPSYYPAYYGGGYYPFVYSSGSFNKGFHCNRNSFGNFNHNFSGFHNQPRPIVRPSATSFSGRHSLNGSNRTVTGSRPAFAGSRPAQMRRN